MAALASGVAPARAQPPTAPIAALEARYQQWLRSVLGLITKAELDYFLALSDDYRRDAFMEAFWKPRDPDPRTPTNELQRRWQETVASNPGGPTPTDARVRLYLFNGPPGRWGLPDGREVSLCFSRSRELEIWFYNGSERTERRFPVILVQPTASSSYEVWQPGMNLRANQRSGLPTKDVSLLCADELLGYAANEITKVASYERLMEELLTPPQPSPEWLLSLGAASADPPPGAQTFEITDSIDFPARNQSRTGLRVLLRVAREQAPGRELDGVVFHHFVLSGEVIREGRLFESFRYLFEGPTPDDADEIPIGFTRYLRSGPATLRLLVEDRFAGRYAQVVRDIEIPSPEGRPTIPPPAATIAAAGSGPSLRLLEPPAAVLAGRVRFEAIVQGEVDRVTFFLDGKPLLSKRRPPYSAELDLGSAPAPHRVRAVGLAGDLEVATDQLWLNQGAQRFRVRMIEPREGGIYPGGLTVRVEVDTPDGEQPERVEIYVGDQRVTTITEPPYARGLRLPSSRAEVVRALATLADGSSAEDAVVVNTSDFGERIAVQLIELPVLVLGRDGRPVAGLERDRFRIFEDGAPRSFDRFEWTDDLPVTAALLIDRSVSMKPELERVSGAALGFARAALRSPRDRIAVLSFADAPAVDAELTADAGAVERALAGLSAFGRTALYDAVARGVNYLEAESGVKALVLFTDGADESSRIAFDQAVAAAQRSGTSIYTVAPAASFADQASRRVLERLAAESGGSAHWVAAPEDEDGDDLDAVFRSILDELRSRYWLAFQVDPAAGATGYRALRVEVDHPGAVVRARSGYVVDR